MTRTARWSRRSACRLLGALAPLVAGCGAREAPPPSWPSPLVGQPIPEFERSALDGRLVTDSELRGRPLIVKFFAKYCEPCKRTLPAVEALWEEESARLGVLGISADERESHARELVGAYGLTFPVIFDRGLVLTARFRVRELPATFVVDRDGRVAWFGGPEASDLDIRRAAQAERIR